MERKQQPVREEATNEADHRILKSSNSVNRRISQGLAAVKEHHDSYQETTRRKRLSSRSDDVENKAVVPTPVSDNKSRHSDPPKPAPPRVSRTYKPTVAASQKQVVRGKMSRDHQPTQGGIKERESKKRMWTR